MLSAGRKMQILSGERERNVGVSMSGSKISKLLFENESSKKLFE